MSKFDALALAVDKPARLLLQHPKTGLPLKDKEGKEAFIDLLSSDSDTARKQQHANANKRFAQRVRRPLTSEELDAENIDILAALTVGWHLVGLDGEALAVPFSTENAKELYAAPQLAWVREQAQAFAESRANFAKASSTNS
jgi:hypothetical protein